MDRWVAKGGLDRAVTREKRRMRRKYKKRTIIPKYMTYKDKKNLKRNLATLGEKKFYLQFNDNQSIQFGNGSTFQVSDVPQGDTDGTRDGDQLTIRSIELGYYINFPSTLADISNVVRVILYQYIDNISTAPIAADILMGPTSQSQSVTVQPYTHDNRFNFKILYDKIHTISLNGPATVARRVLLTKGFRRNIQYNSGGITGTNKIYLLVVSDSGVTNHPLFTSVTKLNFSDH